jgi:hypothetical protein
MVKKLRFSFIVAHRTLFQCDLPTHRPLCTVRGKNETASISYSETGHPNMSFFANFVLRSATKEIQIGIQVIALSDGSKILILHL